MQEKIHESVYKKYYTQNMEFCTFNEIDTLIQLFLRQNFQNLSLSVKK